MGEKKNVLLFLIIMAIPLLLHPYSVDKQELSRLFEEQKYGILLEKTLGMLNSPGRQLSNADREILQYYTGLAYIKDNNPTIGESYLLQFEKSFPESTYLKAVYSELIKLNKNEPIKKRLYQRKLIAGFPKTEEAFKAGIELGKSYLADRKFNYAINVFEKIVNDWKMGEKAPESYVLLTLAYSKTDAYLDALDYLRIAEKKASKVIRLRPDYLFEAGKIFFNTQNFIEASKRFSRFISNFPRHENYPEVLVFLSKSLFKNKKFYDAAIVLLEGLLQNRSLRNPGNKENIKRYYTLLLNLTQALMKLPDNRLKSLQRKHKTFTDIDDNLREVSANSPQFSERKTAILLLSNQFIRIGDLKKAIANYFFFLKRKGDPFVKEKFREYLNRYIKTMDLERDIDKLMQLWVLVKPRKSFLSGENMLILADYLLENNMIQNADEIYAHILRYTLYKDYWNRATNKHAYILFKRGEYQQYLDFYDRLKFYGENQDEERDQFLYYKILSAERLNKENWKVLLKKVSITLINSDQQYEMMKKKADLIAKENRIPEAIAIYERILSSPYAKKQNIQHLSKLADLYFLSGQYEKALEHYSKLESSEENGDWIMYQKIKIYRIKKDNNNARTELEKLKKKYPNSFWLKQLQKNVG